MLDQAGRLLAERFRIAKIDGYRELRQKRYIQWSILQHYEVLPTPLLDLTQSLRVACSFGQLRSTESSCFVYVLGLPYVTNRISIHSEHDIVNVRLLSICPPDALRPYFQEGYLAGTADVTTDFESKTELDFRNRLIAKFEIPRGKRFWGTGFEQIPESALYPAGDKILDLCNQLKAELRDELRPGDIGEFIKSWSLVEERLLDGARRLTQRNVSVREAISALAKAGLLTNQQAKELDRIRTVRNGIVHQPGTIDEAILEQSLQSAKAIIGSVNWGKIAP
jgi:Ribonuclease HepT-like